jgi:hypothetical protein
MKNDLFNEWYRDRFERLRQEPPAEVWDGIESELDLADVWTNVDKSLTASARRAIFRRRMVYSLAALLLLISGGALIERYVSSGKTDQQIADSNSSSARKVGNNTPFIPSNSSNASATGTSSEQPGENVLSAANNSSSIDKNTSSPRTGLVTSQFNDKQSATYLPGSRKRNKKDGINTATGTVDTTVSPYTAPLGQGLVTVAPDSQALASGMVILPDAPVSVRTYIPTSAGLSFGPSFTVNNTWLVNRTTIAGLKEDALYQTEATFGKSYGVSGAYDFVGGWGAQTDLLVSETGQNFHYYDEGFYATKSIAIEYYQANLLARRKKASRFFNTSIPTSRMLLAGTSIRWMRSCNIMVNVPAKLAAPNYAKADLGLVFGYEYEMQVSRKMVLGSGLMADIGLSNINRRKNAEPGSFNRTHNVAFGIHLGARYMLCTK